ncbi:MAG: hypothetical protein C0501_05660 [Isosphaera sp.]|nr:hypothetical protein [Isosphaera sp.]
MKDYRMNAALLVLSSAVGGDVTPAGWAEKPPLVVPAGGCSNCGPARGHAAPTFAHAPSAGCCDPCGSSGGRTKLLDRLKGLFGGRKKKDDCGCAPAHGCGTAHFGSGCATPLPHGAAPAVPATPVTPPKEMPKVDPKTPRRSCRRGPGQPRGGRAPPVVPLAPAAPRRSARARSPCRRSRPPR